MAKKDPLWLQRQQRDPYVRQAQQQGYRSRSAFKLLEIQEKYHLIRPGMQIVDLGAAPGGWSQVVVKCLKGQGKLIAVDRLEMDPLPEKITRFIQGDFLSEEVQQAVISALRGGQADLVLSDLSPNISGQRDVDQARMVDLIDAVLSILPSVLRQGGSLLVKIFQGTESDALISQIKTRFESIKLIKPKSSREKSPEMYLLARDFNMNK